MALIDYIRANIDDKFQETDLPFPVSDKSFAKNDIISDYSIVEKMVYFLESGIVQISLPHQNGEIRILDFFFSNSFFCSYSSLLKQQPSDVQLTAITDCKVKTIHYADLKKAYESSILANKIGRLEAEKFYLKRVKREKDFLTKSAEERYKDIMSENPEFINQISVNKIARYLGIHPESLSRIRKQQIF
jgi:CRP-like cAMP-binding protein